MNARDETWAVFWCSLLAPVLFGEVSARETGRFLRGLAEKPSNPGFRSPASAQSGGRTPRDFRENRTGRGSDPCRRS
jgi:hypothetical protein